ncbi:Succinate-semialdehyde dehydrogenase, mitochondrial [Tetrabaena socialis]|uniref:Succinate-semialdehyde dehydrogenase, mitochondrial n=1 Tax=Tetrabaena socialis TaxID=47790 RepID=A0A2J7ZTZ0_9CHLO|nr:Succinate-semialdehyde dehydrogenase, mitochondrial [Tetrabaena socialis]|eukprot:PNH03734.1 Succinate-semialdehyde dehydrogenase, mitochondrial [Tetrabaena socialis]
MLGASAPSQLHPAAVEVAVQEAARAAQQGALRGDVTGLMMMGGGSVRGSGPRPPPPPPPLLPPLQESFFPLLPLLLPLSLPEAEEAKDRRPAPAAAAPDVEAGEEGAGSPPREDGPPCPIEMLGHEVKGPWLVAAWLRDAALPDKACVKSGWRGCQQGRRPGPAAAAAWAVAASAAPACGAGPPLPRHKRRSACGAWMAAGGADGEGAWCGEAASGRAGLAEPIKLIICRAACGEAVAALELIGKSSSQETPFAAAAPAMLPAAPSAVRQPSAVRHKSSSTSNLEEVAQAAGLSRAAVSEELLSRVKDRGLLHTAGLIGGKWAEAASDKGTFEVRVFGAGAAASVDWFAGEAVRVCGDVLEPPSRDRRMLVLKQPVGVVGAITPWNFPMSMITRKVAPALAAGCTVVLKPSELTPLTALALAELAERAGLPDGCLNLVMGDAPAIGHELVSSDTVRKLGFTGSTAVGRLLAAGAGGGVKRVSLELGGNAPIIVFGDADLELAAKAEAALPPNPTPACGRTTSPSDTSSLSAMLASQAWSSRLKPRTMSVPATSTPSLPTGCTITPCVFSGRKAVNSGRPG